MLSTRFTLTSQIKIRSTNRVVGWTITMMKSNVGKVKRKEKSEYSTEEQRINIEFKRGCSITLSANYSFTICLNTYNCQNG